MLLYIDHSLSSTEADPLHISNVTSSSLKLRWSRPDPKFSVYFEVAVTRLRDHTLVLKKNVSGTELTVDNLNSSQTYHAVVTARAANGQIISIRKAVMSTSEFFHMPTQRFIVNFTFIWQIAY